MPMFSITLGIAWAAIVLMEVTLWFLFSRNIRTMHMPHALDESSYGFFSMGRIRICVILHAVIAFIMVTGFLFWVW